MLVLTVCVAFPDNVIAGATQLLYVTITVSEALPQALFAVRTITFDPGTSVKFPLKVFPVFETDAAFPFNVTE